MKKSTRLISCLIILALSVGLTACGSISVDDVMNIIAPETTPIPGSNVSFATEDESESPLLETCVYNDLDGVFNPFFATSDGDLQVVKFTQLPAVVFGEVNSPVKVKTADNQDGSTTVTLSLQKGILCSDGVELTANDILFDYYVLLDSDYDGPCQINTLPIRGVSDYWNGLRSDLYAKYMMLFGEIYNNGQYDKSLQDALEEAKSTAIKDGWNEDSIEYEPGVKDAQKALDEYDTEKAEQIQNAITEGWRNDAASMVKYTMDNYSGSIELRTDFKREEVLEIEGLQVAYTMIDRGVASMQDGNLVSSGIEKTWTLEDDYPTYDDLFESMYTMYNGDLEQYVQIECIGREDILTNLQNILVKEWAVEDEEYSGEVTSISGISKVDDYTVDVILEICNSEMLNTLCSFYLAPAHIYADQSKMMVGKDLYGITAGDLSSVREKTAECIGAGKFVYNETAGETLKFSVNENYWLGELSVIGAELVKQG